MIKIKELGKLPHHRGGIKTQSLYECKQCKTRYNKINAEMKNHKEDSVCNDCYQLDRKEKALNAKERTCKRCEKTKPIEDYYFKNKEKTHKSNICKECKIKENNVRTHTTSKERRAKWRRVSHAKSYGLTLEEMNAYFIDARCGICTHEGDDKNRIVLDHCHATGKIRGVLCDHCNKALGLFFDDIERLERAIQWLKSNK
jgi:Recombination endonuclease VII